MQDFSTVRQNRDSSEIQLSALNVNYWTLSDKGQENFLEKNRTDADQCTKLPDLFRCTLWLYLGKNSPLQPHTHSIQRILANTRVH